MRGLRPLCHPDHRFSHISVHVAETIENPCAFHWASLESGSGSGWGALWTGSKATGIEDS